MKSLSSMLALALSLLSILAVSPFAWSLECRAVFGLVQTESTGGGVELGVLKQSLYRSTEAEIPRPVLFSFAKALFQKNIKNLLGSFVYRNFRTSYSQVDSFTFDLISIHETTKASVWRTFEVALRVSDGPRQVNARISIRTNGIVAFLGETFAKESHAINYYGARMEDFFGVVRTGAKTYRTFPQTAAILSVLPATLQLSRVMEPIEASLWLNGELNQIMGTRSFFALSYYPFGGGKPYVIREVDRGILENLYARGMLSINTYADYGRPSRNNTIAMPDQARTPFGLDVEIVIHTIAGREVLRPYMVRAIEAGPQ